MEKVWLNEYEEDVPAEIDLSIYSSLIDFFEQTCFTFKGRKAFENMGAYCKYEDLDKYSSYIASYLQQTLGIKKGDRVAIMLPNVLQYPIILFGILKAGGIVVNVNPLYTPQELEHQMNDSGSRVIFVLENFADTLEKVIDKTNIEKAIICKISDMLPKIKGLVVDFVLKYIKKMIPKYDLNSADYFTLAINLGKVTKNEFEKVSLTQEDIAFLQYTGGTTGLSKGAILTHQNMLSNICMAESWLGNHINSDGIVIITPLPLYHIFSLTANCLTIMMVGGTNVLITNPKDIALFIKTIKNRKFHFITGVNTLFNALLNHPDFKDVDFSNLNVTLGGGMAVQESVAKQWQTVTGCTLIEAYGLTETSPAVCINPLCNTEYNGTIGLPLPSTDVEIRDDDGVVQDFDQPGELYVKGPQVMRGYWNQPEETASVLSADGWLRTGDVALVNRNGYVKIVDRKKDMIIVSGFNVYPNQVEDILAKHPGVLEVAVIGVSNEVKGESVKAFIVKKDHNLTKDEIIDFARKELVAYKVPKIIEFREELPKTNVGKILRRALRDESN